MGYFARRMLLRGMIVCISISSLDLFAGPVDALQCDVKQDSPVLQIFVNPTNILRGRTMNVTLSCLIQTQNGNVVTKAELWISRLNSTKRLKSVTKFNQFDPKPYNVTLTFGIDEFRNESSLGAHCYGKKMTNSCARKRVVLSFSEIPASEKPRQAENGHLTSSILVPTIIATVCLILFIAMGLCLGRKCRRPYPPSPTALDPLTENQPPLCGPPDSDVTTVPVYALDQLDDEVIAINEGLSVQLPNNPKFLGTGKFGSVLLGHLIRKEGSTTTTTDVAVKMLNEFQNARHRRDFEEEIQTLSMLEHPNIVRMIGFHVTVNEFYIIMEYLGKGSLLSLLQAKGSSLSNTYLVRVALDISRGMEYLVERQIIHRDLAARNVLIADNDTAKIADFGLARCVEETGEYIASKGYIPVKWVALEALEGDKFTMQSDVWSYGIVLWEIFSLGADPYNEILSSRGANMFDLRDFLKVGKRLNPPENCPNGIYEVMRKCWKPFIDQRPSFMEITKLMQGFYDELNEP